MGTETDVEVADIIQRREGKRVHPQQVHYWREKWSIPAHDADDGEEAVGSTAISLYLPRTLIQRLKIRADQETGGNVSALVRRYLQEAL